MNTAPTTPSLNLHLDVAEVKGDLSLKDPTLITADSSKNPELEKQAQEFADRLVAIDPSDFDGQSSTKSAVDDMGKDLQREASRRSQMLQQPIKALSRNAEDGGPVANALIELKMEVESLDPNRFDFSAGWLSRILGMLPGVGSSLKRYFTQYEKSQTVIDAIINSLEAGRDQLNRDNVTLSEDQKVMRELTVKLEQQVLLGQLVDQKLQYKLEREVQADDPLHKFIQEELLFPLRQRIIDLQQQLAVNQQGVIATEIIIRNNKELIRGVNRALDVTISALQVAVTVALALANQKVVLDKVLAINKTTSDLISGTAKTLRTQGAAIQTQAAGAMLDMDALKSAFSDINAAMDEISQFRRDALPQMAKNILEFDQLTAEGEKAIKKMEQARTGQTAEA